MASKTARRGTGMNPGLIRAILALVEADDDSILIDALLFRGYAEEHEIFLDRHSR
jgi:hypothetical protein